MACTSQPTMKLLSMANSCLISSPSIFNSKITSIPFKPSFTTTKLQLSCSFSTSSLSFSLHKKSSNFRSIVAFVAAQQEEDNTIVLEEEQVGEFTESEGEEAVPEAVGDAAGEKEVEVDDDEEEEEDAGGFSDPPEDAKIFIGNLPYDIDSEKLAQLFEQAGVVEIAEVIYNRETDQSRGFGFVTMSTVEEAEKAVQMLNRYDIGGRILTVNKAAPRGSKPERAPREFGPSYRAYAGNLPWDFDDAKLEEIFSQYGKVVNARVVYDRDSGRSRGFGFVTMSSESELNDAVQNLDGQDYGGRSIRVNVAEDKPRRNF